MSLHTFDLHMHTIYSTKHGAVRFLWRFDSTCTPRMLIRRAEQIGLTGIAVTDHDTTDGGEATKRVAKETGSKLIVITGEEVSTLDGHMLALGVNSTIPRKKSADESIDLIHDAGGIAVPSHPFHPNPKLAIGEKIFKLPKLDALETFNSYNLKSRNEKAQQAAHRLNLPVTGGSDTHIIDMLGNGRTYLPDSVSDEDSAIKAIRNGQSSANGIRTPIRILVKAYLSKFMEGRLWSIQDR